MDLSKFNLFYVCPCQQVISLVSDRTKRPAVCPKCGAGNGDFKMRSLRWVSESKFFSPKTWKKGYWVESKKPLKIEAGPDGTTPMSALLDGIMGGLGGDTSR